MCKSVKPNLNGVLCQLRLLAIIVYDVDVGEVFWLTYIGSTILCWTHFASPPIKSTGRKEEKKKRKRNKGNS